MNMKNIVKPILQRFCIRNISYRYSECFLMLQNDYWRMNFAQYSSKFDEINESPGQTDQHDGQQPKKNLIIIHKKPPQGNASVVERVYLTNKKLFGPLLETSKERKKRLEAEILGIEVDKTSQRKRKKKEKSKQSKEIFSPENCLYFSEGNLNYSFGKGSKNFRGKKLIVTSRLNKKQIGGISEESSLADKIKNDFTSLTSDKFDLMYENEAFSQNPSTSSCLEHFYETPIDSIEYQHETNGSNSHEVSLDNHIGADDNCPHAIAINNSKFTAVPGELNMTEIENFPLFNRITDSVLERQVYGGGSEVVSIGMFDDGYQKLPSVRKILEETMPSSNKIALERWKMKMIKQLGEDGFEQYRQDLLKRGKFFHECIESELSGAPLAVEHTIGIKQLWQSVSPVLPKVKDIRVIESRVVHPFLYYQGAVDCVATYRGTPVLIEWKTSSKPKLKVKSMFDDPLQVVAYLGALNFDENYKLPSSMESALLVVAYQNGLPANVHLLKKDDCQRYWKKWCSRLCQFWKQQSLATV